MKNDCILFMFIVIWKFVVGVVSFILYAKFDEEYDVTDINLLGISILFGYASLLIILLALFGQLVDRIIKRFI